MKNNAQRIHSDTQRQRQRRRMAWYHKQKKRELDKNAIA